MEKVNYVCDMCPGTPPPPISDIPFMRTLKVINFDWSKYDLTRVSESQKQSNYFFKRCLKFIDGIDLNNLVFDINKCNLWVGEKVEIRSYITSGYGGAYRQIFRGIFKVFFDDEKRVLRHMCPLITGEFNSGLCCNPLHLKLGTYKENSNDVYVHKMVKNLINSKPVEYCLEHNISTDSGHIRRLNDVELKMIKKLLYDRNISIPRCICSSFGEEKTHDKFLDQLMPLWENMKTDKGYGYGVIHVTQPPDRPSFDFNSAWEEYKKSHPAQKIKSDDTIHVTLDEYKPLDVKTMLENMK